MSLSLVDLWLREQSERHRLGLCLYCGIPRLECCCAEGEPEEYRPVADGSIGGAE